MTPPFLYLVVISFKSKVKSESGGKDGPSSNRIVLKPDSASIQEVIAPPGPEPITAMS